MEELNNTPGIEAPPTLSESEKLALGRAIVRYGMEAPSEEDTKRVFNWAHQVLVREALLGLVLKGELEIRIREDGELVFRTPQNIEGN